MEYQHRTVLELQRPLLVSKLKTKWVTLQLEGEGILMPHQSEMIRLAETDREQTQRLLKVLPTRGPKAFDVFLGIVRKSQPDVAAALETALEGQLPGRRHPNLILTMPEVKIPEPLPTPVEERRFPSLYTPSVSRQDDGI